jgi:nucleoside 2-deoxyribosyltransferase
MADVPQRLYLAGPMSGCSQYNYPLFDQVAGQLRARGHRVFNPAENPDGGRKRSRAFYMRLDIPALIEADGVVVLPGWRQSRGASLEVWIAVDLGMPVYEYAQANGAITLKPLCDLKPSPLPFGQEADRELPARPMAVDCGLETDPAPRSYFPKTT